MFFVYLPCVQAFHAEEVANLKEEITREHRKQEEERARYIRQIQIKDCPIEEF